MADQQRKMADDVWSTATRWQAMFSGLENLGSDNEKEHFKEARKNTKGLIKLSLAFVLYWTIAEYSVLSCKK